VPRESTCSATLSYLEKAKEASQGPSIHVRVETCLDDPVAAIVAHTISDRTAFIAMATHGRSGLKRLLLGSVTEKVLRQAPVPLLACRPGSRMGGSAHVVALDGSPRAETILEDVVPLSKLMGAPLHLVHVLPGISPEAEGNTDRYLERIAASLTTQGVSVRMAVRSGIAGAEIVRYSSEVAAGLVAMATHGRTGLARALMGSVAEEVLRKGSCPILLRRDLRRLVTPPRARRPENLEGILPGSE